jgi:transmembrane sensor
MSEIVRLKTRAEIDEEAAVWTWRLDSPLVTAADQEAFESWLRQDLRHRRAIDEMSQAWKALDGLAEFTDDKAMAAVASASLQAARRTRIEWWGAAAAMVLAVCAAAVYWQSGGERQTLATAVGQHRVVTLADGSIVTLNTNTILETDLRRHSREIFLRKGEAHFQVAHDGSRPFFVHAGEAVVRAVGTQFEVRVLPDEQVDVVVNEGRVEVQAAPALPATPGTGAGRRAPAHAPRALGAGEQLTTSGDQVSITPVTPQQLASALAWRDGAIVFNDEPLAAAIADIERYTDARIVITDPQIAALKVGGRFRTGDLTGFFDALQSAIPVSVRRASNDLVYIDSRP